MVVKGMTPLMLKLAMTPLSVSIAMTQPLVTMKSTPSQVEQIMISLSSLPMAKTSMLPVAMVTMPKSLILV